MELDYTVLVRQSSGSGGTLVVVVLHWYTSGTQSARVPHHGVSAYGFSVPPGLGEPGAFSPENFIIRM